MILKWLRFVLANKFVRGLKENTLNGNNLTSTEIILVKTFICDRTFLLA